MFDRRNRLAVTALKICLTVVVLAVLIQVVGWSDLIAALATAEWPWLLGMYAVTLVALWLAALQLRLLFAKVGIRLTARRIVLASSLSVLYSLVLPGELASGVAKWADLSAATGQRATVFNAMIYTKLANIIPVIAVGAVALAVEDPFPASLVAEMVAGLAIVVSLATLLLFHAKPGSWPDRLISTSVRRVPRVARLRFEAANASLTVFRSLRLTDHLQLYAFSIVALVMSILGFACTLETLALAIPTTVMLWALAVLMIARQLPITVNNLGVREALLIVMLGGYGVGPAAAVALGLIGFSNVVLVALIGAGYQAVLALRTTA